MKTTIFQYRYNFETKTGEVKIDREYRQKCPRHGGKFVPPLVGELGGAKWVMMKVQKSLDTSTPDSRTPLAVTTPLLSVSSSKKNSTFVCFTSESSTTT